MKLKLKNIFIIVTLIIVNLFFLSCKDKEQEKEKEKFAFITVSKLNFRSEPNTKSSKLGSFAMGEKVKVLKKSLHRTKIGKYNDFWYQVEKDTKKGWLYGAFISFQEGELKLRKELEGRYYNGYWPEKKIDSTSDILKINNNYYTLKSFYSEGYANYTGTVKYSSSTITLNPETKIFYGFSSVLQKYGPYYNDNAKLIKFNSSEQSSHQKTLFIKKCNNENLLVSKYYKNKLCSDSISSFFKK